MLHGRAQTIKNVLVRGAPASLSSVVAPICRPGMTVRGPYRAWLTESNDDTRTLK